MRGIWFLLAVIVCLWPIHAQAQIENGGGTGLPAGCTPGTNPLILCTQGANGNDTLNEARFTDSSPTGTFLNFQNAAKNATLYKVDVLGNVFATSAALGSSAPTACGTATGCIAFIEGSTQCTPIAGQGCMRLDSPTHSFLCSFNNGSEIACGSGTVTHTTSALTLNTVLQGNAGADAKPA